jgi:hypothetical protein
MSQIPYLVKQEPRNRFPAWWAGTTTIFVVPARQATLAGGIVSRTQICKLLRRTGIDSSIPGLLKSLEIRALRR